jgi:hypothetical protein
MHYNEIPGYFLKEYKNRHCTVDRRLTMGNLLGKRIDHLLLSTIALFLFLGILLPLPVRSADVNWNVGDGNWDDAANWDPAMVPGADDVAVLKNSDSYTYKTVTYNTADHSLSGLDISAEGELYGGSDTVMSLNHSAGTLTLETLTPNPNDQHSYLSINGNKTAGYGYGGYAEYNLSDTGVLIKQSYEVKIGTDGTGYFNQSGGTFQFSGALYLGDQATGHGIYNMTGGDIVAGPNGAGGITLGEWGGRGEFYQSGGTVTLDNLQLARQNFPIASNGYYELSGTGHLIANNEEIGILGEGRFNQSGGTNEVTGTLTIRKELVSTSTGLYELSGGELNANRVVNNGTFQYDGGTLHFTVFSGTGTFIGDMMNTTTVAPGNSPGTLTIQGNYSQESTGTLEIELGAAGYDILDVLGTADLAGTLRVLLYEGYTPVNGSFFDIITAEAINGEFGTITGPSGWNWTAERLNIDGTETIRLTANAVPVPPAIWLLGSGLLGLLGIRRRLKH